MAQPIQTRLLFQVAALAAAALVKQRRPIESISKVATGSAKLSAQKARAAAAVTPEAFLVTLLVAAPAPI